MMSPARRRSTTQLHLPLAFRNAIGGGFLLIGIGLGVVSLGMTPPDPWGRLPLSVGAGVLIGLGYQIMPALRRDRDRSPSRVWYVTALWVSIGALAAAVLAAAFHLQSWWAALLTLSTAALAIYLTERFPAGGKWPSAFLLSVAFDALMIFQVASSRSAPPVAVTAVLFVPALAVAIVLTVWAFMVRTLDPAEYAKATEVARGVLCAWLILLVSSSAWSLSGLTVGTSDSLDPVRYAIPIVTFGSLIATVTTGWSRFREARLRLLELELERSALDSA